MNQSWLTKDQKEKIVCGAMAAFISAIVFLLAHK
ncbi:hypothetical protein J2S09_002374 [Bacillus fengqiuensis]|nr:hypothetical protein [Bacillus fengqiuensis]